MKQLSIDIETYSSVDLMKCGVYRYAESDDFEILLFAYSVDGGEVQVVDLACGEKIPDDIIDAVMDNNVIKWAFNAQFERVCLSCWLEGKYRFLADNDDIYLDPCSWRCSQIWSVYLGLPFSLAGVGAILGLKDQKLSEGKKLISYFCKPCRPTKKNGGRTRNLPKHDLQKWELFKRYNRRDVEVEMAIKDRLKNYPVPDFLWDEYHMDQEINDRGVLVDMEFVYAAMEMDNISRRGLMEELRHLTYLDNPNSVIQLKTWLSTNGLTMNSLGKKDVSSIIDTAPPIVKRVLRLRQMIAKSSISKYRAMEKVVCDDDCARGMFQFYGANRSGRWSGRLIQLQNLPQNHIDNLQQARELVKQRDFETMELIFDDIPAVLSQLIRTAFIPKYHYMFYVADFSAIEARVLAWLAGESWREKVFADGGDIYCASASQMFHVPVVKHGINGHLRQKGKIAELALGYGGSIGALKAMGALEMGLKESELQPLVDMWRESNPLITELWWDFDKAAKDAVCLHQQTLIHGVRFFYKGGMLFIELPSGRCLSYVKPKMGFNQFGGECVTYEGIGNTKKWERLNSYGPKFTENIVQGIARDLLCNAMMNLKGMDITMHIHDEVVIEAPVGTSLDDICAIMAQTPAWAEGLLLRADGYITPFYKKD